MSRNKQTKLAKLAFRFVLTIGIVNLFADFTYEGARSITGPFLGSLGASATTGLDKLSKQKFVTSYGVALVYAGLGRYCQLNPTKK